MKKIAFTLLASLSFAAISASSYDDKIYIPSKEVMVGDNGIFVNIDGIIFEADQVGYDKQGIHVLISNKHQPTEACEKCRKEKKIKAEENRKKKREVLDKQKEDEKNKEVPPQA